MNVVYANVRSEAVIEDVAEDLRKLGAQILLVTCCDAAHGELLQDVLKTPPEEPGGSTQGELLQEALKTPPEDEEPGGPTRGGGGKGSEEADKIKRKQEKQYKVARFEMLLVAGRMGILDDVELRNCLKTCGDGRLLIAEVSFSVQICQQMDLRVAVWKVASENITMPERLPKNFWKLTTKEPAVAEAEATWDVVRDTLRRRVVRFLAGSFDYYLLPVIYHLRKELKVNLAAWVRYRD